MDKIMPLGELQRAAGTVLAELSDSNESVLITHRGRPAAVLLPIRLYEELVAYGAEFDELEPVEQIRQARVEIEEGKPIPHREVVARLERKFAVGGKEGSETKKPS